jgi:hypothetical protein
VKELVASKGVLATYLIHTSTPENTCQRVLALDRCLDKVYTIY